MNETIIAQIDREIAAKQAEIAALKAARATLAGIKAPKGVKAAPRPANRREKAPDGSLETAVLALLAKKPGLTNGEIRAALKADKYGYSLAAQYVGKRLSRLVEYKRLKVALDGHERRYSLAK